MGLKILKFIFFGNYFIGLLAVVLTIESTLQLKVPFNSLSYYILLFCAPVVYYTYAYMGAKDSTSSQNIRIQWFSENRRLVRNSQAMLSIIGIVLIGGIAISNYRQILLLPLNYWLTVSAIITLSVLYYGMIPVYFFNLKLRDTGWLKPFLIGLIWAATANVQPLIMLKIQNHITVPRNSIWYFLFLKNWMFCTVNAIMFDIKDYKIDANNQLKTFVVSIGLKKTIIYILIPLLSIGLLGLCLFARYQHFSPSRVLLNLIPFVATAIVASTMNSNRKIFYYLIVIDGLILLKAVCGIIAMKIN